MDLIAHLLSDLARAEAQRVELQDFAHSKGLTPEMMRAVARGRSELGEDSLGRLLVATGSLHEREVLDYLRALGQRPRIRRPRHPVPSSLPRRLSPPTSALG